MAALASKLHSLANGGARSSTTANGAPAGSSDFTASPPAPTPAFLTAPLESDSAWRLIARSLSEREGRRQELGAPSCTVDRLGRPKIVFAEEKGEGGLFSVGVGLGQRNQGKNRYCNIIAYDRTRVQSSEASGAYLNASLVREPNLGLSPSSSALPRKWWIAAQAPVPASIHSFLLSLLSPPTSPVHSASGEAPLPLVELLLQLTPLTEKGHRKAHAYFPREQGKTNVYRAEDGEEGEAVWIRLEAKEETKSYRKSKLTLGREGDEMGRKITHVEYLGWSDHGVPVDAVELLTFLTDMNKLNAQLSAANPSDSTQPAPILVHCSAGVGRTGTYITIASLLPLLTLYKTPPPPHLSPLPSVPANHPLGAYPAEQVKSVERDFVGLTIDGLREQRTCMVQTAVQVRWCYEALGVAWRENILG